MNDTVKSFSIVTGFSVATRLLSFLFKIWMSRSLGAEAVGLYQICISVLLLLFSVTAGAPTVLSRKIAEAETRGDKKAQNALTSAMLLIGLSVAAVLCAVLYACKNHLGVLFADDRCVPLFLIMLPALITSTIYAPIRSWFWGKKNFIAFSSTELLDEVLKIGLSILLAGGIVGTLTGATGVALAFTLSDVVCVLVLLVIFFASGGRLTKPTGGKELVKATLPLSAVRIITSLLSSLTALIIPQRLVANGMTVAMATAEFGRVSGMALPLIVAPVTLFSALSVVLIPDIASLYAKKNLDSIRTKLQAAIVFAALVSSLFFAGYLSIGEQLGVLFFGDAEAGRFVAYCAVLIFPLSLSQVTTPMLNSLGMERRTFSNYILGTCCMLPCIFFLPKYIGVYAMAVGSGTALLLTGVLNLDSLNKKLGGIGKLNKPLGVIAFSIPLGVLGILTYRLFSPYLGAALCSVLVAFYVLFFFVIFVSAFKIIDVKGYIALLKPSGGFSSRIMRAQTFKKRKTSLKRKRFSS